MASTSCRVDLLPNKGEVFIIGGSGFVGTRLTSLLLQKDIPVRIGDLRQSETFPDLWVHCDVRQHQSIQKVLGNATTIINLAAEHRDDVRPLSRYHETNVLGASEVCLAAELSGIKKVLFTSSVAVYGFHPHPVDEEGPFAPFNEYGRTKLEAEKIYRNWASKDPSRTLVIVRPTVIFGEGNRGNVYNLLSQIASGRFLMVGSGKNAKSMAYVGNVASFLEHLLSFQEGEYIFNYVDGPDMETRHLVEYIRACLGQAKSLPSIPKSVAILGGYLFDCAARLTGRKFPISAIRVRKFCESTQFLAEKVKESGFVPPYSLNEGLAATIKQEFPNIPNL